MTRILIVSFVALSGIYIASPAAIEAAFVAALLLPVTFISWGADHQGRGVV